MPVFLDRVSVTWAWSRREQIPSGRARSPREGGIVQAQHCKHTTGDSPHRFEATYGNATADPGYDADFILHSSAEPILYGGSLHRQTACMFCLSRTQLIDKLHGSC